MGLVIMGFALSKNQAKTGEAAVFACFATFLIWHSTLEFFRVGGAWIAVGVLALLLFALESTAGAVYYVYQWNTQRNAMAAFKDAAAAAPAAVASAPSVKLKPAPIVFADKTYYVVSGQFYRLGFSLKHDTRVQMVIDIDNASPVDIVTLPESVSPDEWANLKATEKKLFAMPLAKRAAYKHFETAPIPLPKGQYTVFLDNTGDITPTRGDAPVRLRLIEHPEE